MQVRSRLQGRMSNMRASCFCAGALRSQVVETWWIAAVIWIVNLELFYRYVCAHACPSDCMRVHLCACTRLYPYASVRMHMPQNSSFTRDASWKLGLCARTVHISSLQCTRARMHIHTLS